MDMTRGETEPLSVNHCEWLGFKHEKGAWTLEGLKGQIRLIGSEWWHCEGFKQIKKLNTCKDLNDMALPTLNKNLQGRNQRALKDILLACTILILFTASCSVGDEEIPKNASGYWGCWVHQNPDVFDILLQPGRFSFGTDCKAISSFDIGYFRNDTLILDNGNFEYWCLLQSDTLVYSEGARGPTYKLVRGD